MAKLTDQLSTDMSIKPVREPPAPSTGLATGLNAIGKAIDIFADTNRQNTANAAAKVAAERAARKDTHDATANRIPGIIFDAEQRAIDTADSPGGIDPSSPLQVSTDFSVFGTPSKSLPGDLEGYVNDVGEKLNNVKVSVEQGRLPRISLESARNKEISSLMSAYPEHGDEILNTLEKMGVKASLFRRGQDDQLQHESRVKTEQKLEDEMFTAGAATMDLETLNNTPRSEVIAQGFKFTQAETKMEMESKALEITLKKTDITEKERKFAQEAGDQKMGQSLVDSAHTYFNPIKAALQQSMIEIGKMPGPEQEKAFQLWGPKLKQLSESAKAQLYAKAVKMKMSPDEIQKYMKIVSDNFDGTLAMFVGDSSVIKGNMNALSAFETSLGLKAGEAMPVYSFFEKAGMGTAIKEAVAAGLLANPAVAKAIREEVQGVRTDLGKANASTHLMNLGRLLTGENTITNYSAADAKDLMQSLYGTAGRLSADYASGKEVPTDTMLHAVGNVISAARTVGPGNGLNTWIFATAGAAGRETRQALIKATKDPQYNDKAEATISGSRAASIKIINAMKPQMAEQTDGWSVKINKEGKAIAFRDLVDRYVFGGERRPQKRIFELTRAPIPTKISQYVKTYNTNVDNLVLLNDYDPLGTKGATPLEIQRYYSLGALSKPFQGGEKIDQNKKLEEAMGIVEDAFEGIPAMNTDVTSIVDKPRIMNYEARAAGFKAVPDSVETLGHASEFAKQVNKAGVASSAMGTYQIVGQTLREFAPKVFGEDWENVAFTPANQDKVAEAIFNERKSTAASLKSTWVSLSLADAERVRKMPWSQAKGIIARGESG